MKTIQFYSPTFGLELLSENCQICFQNKGKCCPFFFQNRFGESLAVKKGQSKKHKTQYNCISHELLETLGKYTSNSKTREMLSFFFQFWRIPCTKKTQTKIKKNGKYFSFSHKLLAENWHICLRNKGKCRPLFQIVLLQKEGS